MPTIRVRIPVAVRPDGRYAACADTTLGRCAEERLHEKVEEAARSAAYGSKCGPPVVYILEADVEVPVTETRTATVVQRIEPTYPVAPPA